MDNKNVTYEELLKLFGRDEDVMDLLYQIIDEKAQNRLFDDAVDYYSKKYNCDKSEVCLGSFEYFDEKDLGEIPYVVILGNLQVERCTFSASKLKAVYGTILAQGAKVESFPELQYAANVFLNHSTVKSLPKLKVSGEVDLRYSTIEELGLEKCVFLNLIKTPIKTFNVKRVEERLLLEDSAIEDISSLEYVGRYIDANGVNIKKVNPKLSALIEETYKNPKLENLLKETRRKAGMLKKDDEKVK